MTKNQYKKLVRIQNELCGLRTLIEHSKLDKRLRFGNGCESEQLDCAMAAIDCILQEVLI